MCQDGCRLCSRGCSRVPRAVVQSRSLLWPRGCVPGQGLCRLPGSALSCPGSCPGRCGETCGGKEPPGTAGQGRAGQGRAGQGRAGAFCCHSCCLGQGDHSYTAPQGVSKGTLQEERQGRDFPFLFLREGERVVDRILKGAVKYEHISENPELYISHSGVK